MANICMNSIVFRARTEKALVDFFNTGIKTTHPDYEPRTDLEGIADWIRGYNTRTTVMDRYYRNIPPALALSSWMPVPEDYSKYPLGDWIDGLRPGDKVPGTDHPGGSHLVATEEMIAEMKSIREKMRRETGQGDLYHYNLWKYSVKWDCPITDDSDMNCGRDDDGNWYAGLDFDSPWNGPVAWVRELHRLYPDLDIRLFSREDDMDIMTAAVAMDGKFAVLKGDDLKAMFPGEFAEGGFFEDWECDDE